MMQKLNKKNIEIVEEILPQIEKFIESREAYIKALEKTIELLKREIEFKSKTTTDYNFNRLFISAWL
jgi:hypothetical protein